MLEEKVLDTPKSTSVKLDLECVPDSKERVA